ncbi:hypothetical protein [Streptomyces longhuiensis]|uniref:hypothetical protein n=1 Tax=Streptomyces longhuiensis TaxID=2880933 RepID=UPI001D0B8DB8|nr:hypothetical protein [Streptomyces longhuiensis]UDM05512.1 hypothetical protein LGI35_45530 [Streptomyces longhuiensis]
MIVTVPASAGFGKAELQIDIDDAEHERRRAAGLGVATGHGFGGLDVLMALPHGLPLPVADLTDHQRAYVTRAPAGICTIDGQNVTRHVTWPGRVTVATVRATSPSKMELDAAAQFAPFCARRVIITRPLNRLLNPETLLDFGFYGVGVYLQHDNGELETLVEPRPWRPIRRHTPTSAA